MSKFEFKNEYEIIKYLKKEFCITEKHAEEVIKDITDIENNKYTDFNEEQQKTCVYCDSSYRLQKCDKCNDLCCGYHIVYCKEYKQMFCEDCEYNYCDCPFCYVECCEFKKDERCSNYCEKYKSFNGIDRVNICWTCKSHFCEEHMIICQHCKAQHCGKCIHEGDGCRC